MRVHRCYWFIKKKYLCIVSLLSLSPLIFLVICFYIWNDMTNQCDLYYPNRAFFFFFSGIKIFILLLFLFEPKRHSQESLFVFCLESGSLISATSVNTPCLNWLHLLHITSNYIPLATKSLFLICYHLCLISIKRKWNEVTPI